jgi:hypothetical protein
VKPGWSAAGPLIDHRLESGGLERLAQEGIDARRQAKLTVMIHRVTAVREISGCGHRRPLARRFKR